MRTDYLIDFNLIFNEAIIANNDDKIIVWNEIIKNLKSYKLSLNIESIYWFDTQGNWYFELKKSGDFWCSYRLVWSVFENEFDMTYADIQFFIKNQVEEIFKQEIITPTWRHPPSQKQVEEVFKQEVITPYLSRPYVQKAVEEVFKQEVITPSIAPFQHKRMVENIFKNEIL